MNHLTIVKQILCIILVLPCSSWAQSITFSGKVVDGSNNNLTGALVVWKGTRKNTTADMDGLFYLSARRDSLFVEVSHLGFESQTISLSKKKTTTIILKENSTQLDEAIVTGSHVYRSGGGYPSYTHIGDPLKSYNELYGSGKENPFQNPLHEALSSFPINIDKTSSYINLEKVANFSRLTQYIRTEELINHFDYNYPTKKRRAINVSTEISECPWNNQHQLVHIGIKAKESVKNKLPASHIVLLIDLSGPLDLIKISVKHLLPQLRKIDRVSLVTYGKDKDVQLVMENMKGTQCDSITTIINGLQYFRNDESSELALRVAYAVANRYFIKNGNNRIIITKNHMYMNMLMDDLDPRIDQKNKMDISLTNAHYEQRDYENEAITMLTENKQVRHIYRDATNSVENILVSDFLASRLTVAKDVKVQVVFNPAKVQAYRLIGYEKQLTHREVSDKEPKNTGDIGVGHSVTALYEIIPAGIESRFIPTFDSLNQNMQPVKDTKYRGSGLFALKVRYKSIKKDRNKVTHIRVKDQHKALKNTSDNFRFSAAVAEMGLLFNRSAYIPTASYSAAIELAEGAYGEDKEGTRRKFVELMKKLSWVYIEK